MDAMVSFGSWLRRRRKALDLTQHALAQRLHCAKGTIQKLEADERRPSRELAVQLAQVLAIPPAEQATFVQCARGERAAACLPRSVEEPGVPPLVQLAPSPGPTLPAPLTRLIGRTQEVAAVCRLLQEPEVRLVTLTGVGGTGKTRLAFQVAADLEADFADGVAVVELAPLRDPRLVGETIARTLGVQEAGRQDVVAQLTAYLRTKHLLLVLDNFEHLLPAAPLVADLLRAAPGLTVLVTSRAVLHLTGEHEFPVPPLTLPAPGVPLEALAESEAVRLFVARAQAVTPDFQFTGANAAAVAALCRHLEGLPLLLELAAARTKLFPPALLLQRLAQRLPELTGGPRDAPRRQQTLRQTIDWSYHLLAPMEQVLFRRLAVFVGGTTLAAAEAVCTASGDPATDGGETLMLDVVTGLQALVDQSLLQVVDAPEDEPRFTMLEAIREYALERLRASGEEPCIWQQYVLYYLALVEVIAPRLHGPDQTTSELQRLDREHDNLRAVLQWTVEHAAAEQALRLASALAPFWLTRGYWSEGRRWLDAVLALDGPAALGLRAQALLAAGEFSHFNTARYEEALRLFRALGDTRNSAQALALLANEAWRQSDLTRSATLFQESLDLFRELDDIQGSARILLKLGWLEVYQGAYTRGLPLVEESLRLARMLGDRPLSNDALVVLGNAAMEQGEFARAVRLKEQTLAFFRDLGFKPMVAWTLDNLSWIAMYQGDYVHGTALNEESLALFREVEQPPGEDGTACALMLRGLLELGHGTLTEARVALVDSLGRYAGYHDQRNIARCLEGFAALAAAHAQEHSEDSGHARRAARLWGAAEALRRRSGFRQPPADRVHDQRHLAGARAHVDATVWKAAWAEGRALTTEQAITYALTGEGPNPEPLPMRPRPGDADQPVPACPAGQGHERARLTPREQEVLRLVGQGFTDIQIAAELGVSPRTVSNHLHRLYRKWQVPSRTAALRRARDQELPAGRPPVASRWDEGQGAAEQAAG